MFNRSCKCAHQAIPGSRPMDRPLTGHGDQRGVTSASQRGGEFANRERGNDGEQAYVLLEWLVREDEDARARHSHPHHPCGRGGHPHLDDAPSQPPAGGPSLLTISCDRDRAGERAPFPGDSPELSAAGAEGAGVTEGGDAAAGAGGYLSFSCRSLSSSPWFSLAAARALASCSCFRASWASGTCFSCCPGSSSSLSSAPCWFWGPRLEGSSCPEGKGEDASLGAGPGEQQTPYPCTPTRTEGPRAGQVQTPEEQGPSGQAAPAVLSAVPPALKELRWPGPHGVTGALRPLHTRDL